jgi:RNA polymerase sigma-70 factor, ECF subfamily
VHAEASGSDAFTQFYREHAPRVYMLALRLCRDATDASEVLSETFVRAWRGLEGFRGESTPNTWLHTIAVRVWRDIRRRRGRPMESLDEDTVESLHSRQYGLSAQYDDGDHRIDIEQAVASLPEGARDVLILFGIEGYSHAEIASMLGVSVGTVKSQLHRARKLVLEHLDR